MEINEKENSTQPPIAGIIAPPPILYLAALIMGLGLQIFFSRPLLESFSPIFLRVGLGIVLCAAGAFLARWSFNTMREIGTTGNPHAESTALATHGAFRLSRNPIYLAMTMMYLGIAFVVDSMWLLILLVPLLAIMQWGVILREERYLVQQFGSAYTDYQKIVRRWI